MDQKHQQLVAAIAKQVSSFYERSVPFRVYHGSTNSTRTTRFDKDKMLDVSQLNQVLSIHRKSKTAIVESNVAMDALVAATLKEGLVPPVVMEFPGITVGGGIQGGAGESSSYKWGTFNRTVNWYELILGDGSLVRVSPRKYADLYWGAAGSYGSLGVVTAAEIKLMPAKQYVSTTYIPVKSFAEAIQTLQRAVKKRPDYVDGIMFSKDLGVVIIGNQVDASSVPEKRFSRPHDDWFYLHAQKLAIAGHDVTEKIPLHDYLFRYDRGAFWMGTLAFHRFKTPFNGFTRWLLNPMMTTRKMYTALQASGGASQEYIIQDLALPKETAVQFMDFIDTRFGIYPLWLCPLRPDKNSPLLSSHIKTKLVINVGVWGRFTGSYSQFVKANRNLEEAVRKLGGKKWLYAHTYYEAAAFWRIYGGKTVYDALRKKYKAQKLPSVYEKVRVTKQYAVHAKTGIFFALLGLNGIKRK